MDLTPTQRSLMQFWGTIEASVSARVSTADLWAAVRYAASAAGVSIRGASAADMSVVRAAAASMRNAATSLNLAAPGTTIDSSMIGQAPWGRPLAEQNAFAAFQVRFEMTTTANGVESTSWFSTLFEGSLPATTDLLREQVEQDAANLADDYQVGFGGVGAVQVLAV